jgi:hypothetical protein
VNALMSTVKGKPEETFEHKGGSLYGKAFSYPGEVGGQRTWILHSFMATPGSLVEVVFYMQFKNDVAWAVNTWKTIRYSKPR